MEHLVQLTIWVAAITDNRDKVAQTESIARSMNGSLDRRITERCTWKARLVGYKCAWNWGLDVECAGFSTHNLKFGILQGLLSVSTGLNWSDLALMISMQHVPKDDTRDVYSWMTSFFVWTWFWKNKCDIYIYHVWGVYVFLRRNKFGLNGLPLVFLFFIGPRRLGFVGMLLGLVWLGFAMWGPMDFTLLHRRATLVAVPGDDRCATLSCPP